MLSRTRFVVGSATVLAIATLVVLSGSQAQQPTGPKSGGTTTGLITSVPRTMTYQGILKGDDGEPLADSTLDITFRIHGDEIVYDLEWEETVEITTDDGGYFSATLNNVNLPFDEDYWLELQVEGDPQPLEPRQALHMAPYSARTDTSDYAFNSLGGGGWVDDGPVVRLETSTDKVGIGTSSAVLPLHVVSNGATHQLRLESTYSGGGRWSIGQSDDGFGCPGGLLVFTPDDEGSVNSVMALANSGNVGIGMTSPAYKLDVSGDIRSTGTIYGTVSNADKVDQLHASSTATPGYLYPLDGSAKIPNDRLYTGHGNGLNADMVDGKHDGQLSADEWDGHNWGDLYPNADMLDSHHWGELYPDADRLDGQHASYFTPLSQFNSHASNPSAHHAPVTSVNGLSGGTITSSTTINGTAYADKFYVYDAGDHNALRVANSSSSYPTIWSRCQGDNIAIYGQVGNGNAMKADNSSTSFPSIYTNNSQSNSSQVLGVYAYVATSNDYGIGTNGRGYFGGGILLTSVTTSRGERAMTSPMVPECEIYLSGSSNLSLGRADIRINPDMVEIIADSEPFKVIVTPTGMCNGMAVTSKESNGFTVEELGNGTSNSGFDWLVIAQKAVSYTNKTAEEMPPVPRVMEIVPVESPIN